MTRFLLLSFFCTSLTLSAQRQLEIEDLASWNRIENAAINASGSHSVYVMRPDKGDPTTVLVNHKSGEETRFATSDRPTFSYDGNYLLLLRHPDEASSRRLKKKDQAKKLATMDTLVVVQLKNGKTQEYPAAKRFKTGEKWSDFYAYTTTSVLVDSLQKGLVKKADRLVVRRFGSKDSLSVEGVTDYAFAENKAGALAVVAKHDSLWTDHLLYLDVESWSWTKVIEQAGNYAQPALSPDGQKVAFLANQDTTDKQQAPFHLHHWQKGQTRSKVVSRNAGEWMPSGYRISDDGDVRFSDSGNKLYFGIASRRPEKDTSLLEEDIADVEVWTTQDARLYTQENNRLEQEKKRTYRGVYNANTEVFTLIESTDRKESRITEDGDGDWALTYDETAFLPRLTWVGGPSYKDIYLLNLSSGEEIAIAKEMRGSPAWSPGANYVYWYNYVDTAWFAFDVKTQKVNQLTDNRLGAFYEETNDRPTEPWAYGSPGWLENDEAMIIYDRYDWWKIDPSGNKKPQRITDVRDDKKRLRYLRLDREKEFFKTNEKVMVAAFDEDNYYDSYAWLDLGTGTLSEILPGGEYDYQGLKKARLVNNFIFQRGDFSTFPDLHFAAAQKSFATLKSKQISNANPQQKEFGWGSSELFEWIDNQGRQLRGILVKPPNFDPNKQYPLMVNFYERSSEGVYRHRAPYPHRSTINYSFYASRGYVIFNPDVIYREGYPGESAYDCVMSGVTALIGKGFVDVDKIGLQGHSWGGYQAAYMATKTDLFACIESGAPVVNMFSAYGGIRWGSGMSRQFQYERTQSRIGGTPWEYPLRYLENSPLFFTDKVNTPILIMHNDKDGAVPWYQGIEYFTALRRLGKPAWMLNYRGEPHWPLKPANRSDFQHRMSQFFDHYLLGKPQPRWMKEGVSPLRRGIEQGYETRE